MVGIVRHRQLKGSVTDRSHLNHRATPRLHKSVKIHMGDFGVNWDFPKKVF